MEHFPAVIAGAGPAGLAAAYELSRQGIRPLVLEKSHKIGGIARTEVYQGFRFDIGGHRFFTKVDRISQLWQEMLGDDLIRVRRRSHIYYAGKFFNYPLELLNALGNLGVGESSLVLLSYLKAKLFPLPEVNSFDQWVTNHFGRRLFQIFFKDYTEKVWGIPCSEIHADWAAQRIKGLSLLSAVKNAILGSYQAKTLIKEFLYPKHGPGMMWERFRDRVVENGGEVRLNHAVVEIRHDHNRLQSLVVESEGNEQEIAADHFISSMPLPELILGLRPSPPAAILDAARNLNYRGFILVGLILNKPNLFPDNWIYVNSHHVQVGRIQNFGNWSRAMVPDPDKSCLGLEYFCNEGDSTWNRSAEDLIRQATVELQQLGLAGGAEVVDGVIFRQPKAYPVYCGEFQRHLTLLQEYVNSLEKIQSIGRNGMHRYNNMDHSMLGGLLAAENVQGAHHDCWEVNRQQEYHESLSTRDSKARA